jgi:putative transposase
VPGTTKPWLAALDVAVHRQFPEGARGTGVALLSDNGRQPTALAFMEACHSLEVHQAFTRDNHPKGHADPERCRRTLKAEGLWLQAGTCPLALSTALERWSATDNEHSLHSALGDKTPAPVERDHDISPSPPFLAA